MKTLAAIGLVALLATAAPALAQEVYIPENYEPPKITDEMMNPVKLMIESEKVYGINLINVEPDTTSIHHWLDLSASMMTEKTDDSIVLKGLEIDPRDAETLLSFYDYSFHFDIGSREKTLE
ncbi:MAG: hypothetical protein ABIE94_04500 [archaeon]